MEKNELILRAKAFGSKTPVDAAPDMTAEGFSLWKEDLVKHFRERLDRFFDENHPIRHEEVPGEIMDAMKDGFKEMVHSQPYVENPFHPKEPPPRKGMERLIDEAFDFLKVEFLGKNELIVQARVYGSEASLIAASDLEGEELHDFKEDVVNHFRGRLDRFFVKNHPIPHEGLHDEIVEAMKDGFKDRVQRYPMVEDPHQQKEPITRRRTARLIDEAFDELKSDSRRRRALRR